MSYGTFDVYRRMRSTKVDEVPVETHELGHMIDILRDIWTSKRQILKATNQATIFGGIR